MVLNSLRLVGLLALLLAYTHADDCPPDFEDRCLCGRANYNGQMKYIVNCTNTGFQHPAMLEKLPVETEVVIFTGNNIPSMPWNIFGKMNDYPYLDTIDMTNNNIEEIKGKTYHRVGRVKTLILNHNQLDITKEKNHPRIFSNFVNLESLHLTNAFTEGIDSKEYLLALEQIFIGSNLSSLIKLHLEQNEIWYFKNPKIFCNLPSLMDLHLGDNNLTDLSFDFTCLRNLRFLDLRDNRINTLSNHTLMKFDDLPEKGANVRIDMLGNPFNCDCNIADFLNWMRSTKVDVMDKENYSCADGRPDFNINVRLWDVHQIQCAVAMRQDHQGTTVILGILVVLMITLLLIIGYMNFNTIRVNTNTLLDKVCRRGQYTSILSKPEDQEVHV